MVETPHPPREPIVVFRSDRQLTLRFVTLVCLIPVPLTTWLLTLPPTWDDTPFGPLFWWVLPLCGLALAATLPASLFLLHDRYVIQLERLPTGLWRLQTFLLWGQRTRELDLDAMIGAQLREHEGRFDATEVPSVNAPWLEAKLVTGKQLIFDRQGSAPQGWEALRGVLGREKKVKPRKR